MDDRVIEFVRGLRAAGVRVSLAESMDAMHAVEVLGMANKGAVPRIAAGHPGERIRRFCRL